MEQDTITSKLQEHPHLLSYPRLTPWVGREYGKDCKRLLIIGESHYLPSGVSFHHCDTDWYAADESALEVKIRVQATRDQDKKNGIESISTSGILRARSRQAMKRKKFKKGHTIHQRVFNEINDMLFSYEDYRDAIDHVAFYNFFQRPAKNTGGSLSPSLLDKKIALELFEHVIDVLQPELIVVVSRKVGKLVSPFINRPYVVTPHPACSWWYRPSKTNQNMSGKELLIGFLSANDIPRK